MMIVMSDSRHVDMISETQYVRTMRALFTAVSNAVRYGASPDLVHTIVADGIYDGQSFGPWKRAFGPPAGPPPVDDADAFWREGFTRPNQQQTSAPPRPERKTGMSAAIADFLNAARGGDRLAG